MALPDFEQEYLDEAMEFLNKGEDFSGMTLDRYILRRLDEDEETDDFDEDEVVFLKR